MNTRCLHLSTCKIIQSCLLLLLLFFCKVQYAFFHRLGHYWLDRLPGHQRMLSWNALPRGRDGPVLVFSVTLVLHVYVLQFHGDVCSSLKFTKLQFSMTSTRGWIETCDVSLCLPPVIVRTTCGSSLNK